MTALTHLSPRVHPRLAVLFSSVLAVVAITVPIAAILSDEPDLTVLAIGVVAGIAALAISDLRWEGGDMIRLFSVAGVLLALPASLLALVPTASATTARLAGDDRVATAIAVSAHVHESADAVVVVAADADADAIAAAPLAAHLGAPLLLAGEGIGNEVERLGATRAYLVGGTVDNDLLGVLLHDAGIDELVPLVGDDRYATSAAVVSQIRPNRVYVSSGWADAVAAAPLMADGGAVLTVPPDALPPAAVDVLERIRPSEVVVVGGEAVVSAGLEDELAALLPAAAVSRLAGDDRWATSLAVLEQSGLPADRVWLAAGLSWSDSLAGALGAVTQDQPLLLVPSDRSTDAATVTWLREHRTELDEVTIVGGDAAVPSRLVTDVTDR